MTTSDGTSCAPPDWQPEVLQFSIGGYPGPSFNVCIEDGALVFEGPVDLWESPADLEMDLLLREERGERWTADYGAGIRLLAPVDAVDWSPLRRSLVRAGVNKWKSKYVTPGVLDGTHWAAHVEAPRFFVKSYGHESYPPRFGTLVNGLRRLFPGEPSIY